MIVIFVMSCLEHTGVLQWLSYVNQMASTNDIISIPAEQPCGLTLAYHLGGGGCVLPGLPAALLQMCLEREEGRWGRALRMKLEA